MNNTAPEERSECNHVNFPCVPGHEIAGGIAGTQQMLDFCGEHDITADVEVLPIQEVNEADGRLLKSEGKYRFAIDMVSFRAE